MSYRLTEEDRKARSERAKKRNTKHGKHGSNIYKRWHSMICRCKYPGHKGWSHYGGKGISVCERWRVFENFYADMGEPPFPKAQLDRIDGDGNYDPSNVRWVTTKQQQRNRSDTHFLEHRGMRLCITDWSAQTGILAVTIKQRLRMGWAVPKVLETAVSSRRKKRINQSEEAEDKPQE